MLRGWEEGGQGPSLALVAALGFSLVISPVVEPFYFLSFFLNLGLLSSLTWLDLMEENNAENLNHWLRVTFVRAVIHFGFTSSKLIRNCSRLVEQGRR